MEVGDDNSELTVLVPRKKLVPLITCPICNKIFKDPMSISECLHTFCRKCIVKTITEEDFTSCPVCNIDLGCSPLDKLRPDHNWHNISSKIFPRIREIAKEPEFAKREGKEPAKREGKEPEFAKREGKEPEFIKREGKEHEVPTFPMPARRKERSLSSLVSTSKVPNHGTVVTGRRKHIARKGPISRGSTIFIDEPIKEVEEDHPEGPSSPMPVSKIAQNKKQPVNISMTKSSKRQMPNKGKDKSSEPLEGMTDLWKPLDCLVEAVGTTKSNTTSSGGPFFKEAASEINEHEANVSKAKGKQVIVNKPKVHVIDDSEEDDDEEYVPTPAPSALVVPRKMRRGRPRKAVAPDRSSVRAQTVVNNAATSNSEERVNPIWLSLVASDNQGGDAPLPQIPSCYLMIKNVNLPVSFIKKYLVQKLDLDSEDEVEISLHGQPLLPTFQLHNLSQLWSTATPTSKRITTSVGSSAKNFVMVLSYGRKY